jgi:hypothetical protein
LSTAADEGAFRLIEEYVGVGRVAVRDRMLADVRYEVRRFQAMTPSGMPVPGLHRIEGRLDVDDLDKHGIAGPSDCTLHLEDGRSLRLTLLGSDGRVLAEGHGPSRCQCC